MNFFLTVKSFITLSGIFDLLIFSNFFKITIASSNFPCETSHLLTLKEIVNIFYPLSLYIHFKTKIPCTFGD